MELTTGFQIRLLINEPSIVKYIENLYPFITDNIRNSPDFEDNPLLDYELFMIAMGYPHTRFNHTPWQTNTSLLKHMKLVVPLQSSRDEPWWNIKHTNVVKVLKGRYNDVLRQANRVCSFPGFLVFDLYQRLGISGEICLLADHISFTWTKPDITIRHGIVSKTKIHLLKYLTIDCT